jgi:hypothetical protein
MAIMRALAWCDERDGFTWPDDPFCWDIYLPTPLVFSSGARACPSERDQAARGAGTIYWGGRSHGKAEAFRRLDVAIDEQAAGHVHRWIDRLGLRGLGLGLVT